MEPIAYVNGRLEPLSQAKIAITDRGFLYGDGLFETLRTYNRKPFLLEEHIKRLMEGASCLRFGFAVGKDDIVRAVHSTIKANQFEEMYLRITLTRGSGGEGLLIPEEIRPTLVVFAELLPSFSKEQEQGIKVVVLEDRRGALSFLKSINLLPNLLARSQAREAGVFEALLVDATEFIWEGTVSNLFIVKEGYLITPPAEGSILPGITRRLVIELADEMGIKYQEVPIKRENLIAAEEIFLTNSLIEIVPVVLVEGRKVPIGSITRALQAKYRLFTRNFAHNLS